MQPAVSRASIKASGLHCCRCRLFPTRWPQPRAFPAHAKGDNRPPAGTCFSARRAEPSPHRLAPRRPRVTGAALALRRHRGQRRNARSSRDYHVAPHLREGAKPSPRAPAPLRAAAASPDALATPPLPSPAHLFLAHRADLLRIVRRRSLPHLHHPDRRAQDDASGASAINNRRFGPAIPPGYVNRRAVHVAGAGLARHVGARRARRRRGTSRTLLRRHSRRHCLSCCCHVIGGGDDYLIAT